MQKFALPNQAAGAARVYVIGLEGIVIGYYSISAGSAEPASASKRMIKGLSQHQPVPIVLLGRLGVEQTQQGRGSLLRTWPTTRSSSAGNAHFPACRA